MEFAVRVALDDVIAHEAGDSFIRPVVFRYIREILRHIRIQDGEESVHAGGEVSHLCFQRIGFLTGELVATLTEANGYAAAYHVLTGAECGGEVHHHIIVRAVEGAERCCGLAAVVADRSGDVPLGVRIEFHRMQVRHSCCIRTDLIDLAFEIILHVVELSAIHCIFAALRNAAVSHIRDLLVIRIDAIRVDVGLVSHFVGFRRHIASDGRIAANSEISADFCIFRHIQSLGGGGAGDFERARGGLAGDIRIAADAEVFHHFCIVHGDLTGGDGIALDGGIHRRASATFTGDRRRCLAVDEAGAVCCRDHGIRISIFIGNRIVTGSCRILCHIGGSSIRHCISDFF